MAMASLLAFSATPLTSSHKTHLPSTLYSLKPSSFLTFTKPRRLIISAQSNNNNSADTPDRIISAICYFYPFFDGIHYGKYVITQFTPLQVLLQPLVPAIRVFNSFPFNGFLVFLTLYFIVVRNPNFSRYVRFNTMQAIVLDVLLIFPDLLERSFHPTEGLGLDLVMSLDSTVFLFLLVCLMYGSGSCFLGQVPRLPIVAEAAERASPEAMSSSGTRSNQDDGYHCSNLQPEPGSSTGSRQCKLIELSVSCDPGIKNWNMAVKQAPCGAIPVKQKQ